MFHADKKLQQAARAGVAEPPAGHDVLALAGEETALTDLVEGHPIAGDGLPEGRLEQPGLFRRRGIVEEGGDALVRYGVLGAELTQQHRIAHGHGCGRIGADRQGPVQVLPQVAPVSDFHGPAGQCARLHVEQPDRMMVALGEAVRRDHGVEQDLFAFGQVARVGVRQRLEK